MNNYTNIVNKLTVKEYEGLKYEGIISEMLFSLRIDHDELPHLFAQDFKRNIAQGTDFKSSVGEKNLSIEAKKWKRVYPSWLYAVTDRFMGKGNYGDINLLVVNNLYSTGWFSLRHKLSEYGIKVMTDYQLYKFLIELMLGGYKYRYSITKYRNRINLAYDNLYVQHQNDVDAINNKMISSILFHIFPSILRRSYNNTKQKRSEKHEKT